MRLLQHRRAAPEAADLHMRLRVQVRDLQLFRQLQKKPYKPHEVLQAPQQCATNVSNTNSSAPAD